MNGYPVFYDQSPSVERNRLTIFFRGLICIPHFIVLALYAIGFLVAVVVAWFALLFTGSWPPGLYSFCCGFLRFTTRVMAYYLCITDVFPPFDGGEHPEYPVQLQIAPPKPQYSRVKVFFRYFMAIPISIINYAMMLWLLVVAIGLWFSGVFLGRTSQGMLEAMRLPMAFYARGQAFTYLVSEDWPPFDPGTRPEAQPAGLA